MLGGFLLFGSPVLLHVVALVLRVASAAQVVSVLLQTPGALFVASVLQVGATLAPFMAPVHLAFVLGAFASALPAVALALTVLVSVVLIAFVVLVSLLIATFPFLLLEFVELKLLQDKGRVLHSRGKVAFAQSKGEPPLVGDVWCNAVLHKLLFGELWTSHVNER